jgi:hypothetical protein
MDHYRDVDIELLHLKFDIPFSYLALDILKQVSHWQSVSQLLSCSTYLESSLTTY